MGKFGKSKNRPNSQAVLEFSRISRYIYPAIGRNPITLWRSKVPLLVDTRMFANGRIPDKLYVWQKSPIAVSIKREIQKPPWLLGGFGFPRIHRDMYPTMWGYSIILCFPTVALLVNTRRAPNGGFLTNYKFGRNPHAP